MAAAARTGDAIAFAKWVARTERHARGFCSTLGVRAEDVDDVCQDAYERAWRGFAALREPRASVGWLRRLCRHVVVDRARKRTVVALALDDVDEGALADRAGNVEQSFVDNEWRASLVDALNVGLARLAPAVRDVIVMRDVEGIDAPTIARRLAIPLGTVESRTHRGRRALRAVLEGLNAGLR